MKLILVGLAAVVAVQASPQVLSPRPMGGIGYSNAPCSFWTSQRDIPLESSQPNFSSLLEFWLVGFIAGAGSKTPAVAAIDPREAAEAMDEHCRTNPSQTFSQAAAVVVEQSLKRRTPKR
jgi:hypothetical protein